MAKIYLKENEDLEGALRRFKRKVQKENIIKDLRQHAFYMKPGDKKRAKQALAQKRKNKKDKRNTLRHKYKPQTV